MTNVIKFPYRHPNEIIIDDIHSMIDEFPTDDKITGFMVVVTTQNGNILTCYDTEETIKAMGCLEFLKNYMLQNMG